MKKIISIFLLLVLILPVVGCSGELLGYRLSVEDREDLLYEQPKRRYSEGERVIIKTHILTDVSVECFVNGESIGKQTAIQTDGVYTHWEFYFEMPAQDVTVTFEVTDGFLG